MTAPESRVARRFLVSGRVQGVGFRHFTSRAVAELAADGCAVTGWVRNLTDGRVEVHAEGTPEALEALAARLAQGPRFGSVRAVRASPAELELRSDFEVRSTAGPAGT